MLQFITSKIPASLIRFIGRLQFKIPALKRIINVVGQRVVAGEGTIQRGIGKGLRFDATGCNPGYLTGTTEPEEQKLLAEVLENGSVFYDLGANAGFYAVAGARLTGENGNVYAFEPTPQLADRIRYNAQMNGFENIEVVEAAVCDENGTIEFGADGLSIQNSIQRANQDNAIEVPALTLDEWSTDKPKPDVIMIDIEGAEIEALRGALTLLREYRPILMVEVHWLGQAFVDFVEDELVPLGYQATRYDGSPLPTGRSERYHALIRPKQS